MSPRTSSAKSGESGKRQLTATVEPENATNKDVLYEIEPATDGLTVNTSGLIEWTADVPAGAYTTTAITDDGNHTDTHTLTLTEPEEPEEPTDPEEGE